MRPYIGAAVKDNLNVSNFRIVYALLEGIVWKIQVEYFKDTGTSKSESYWPYNAIMRLSAIDGKLIYFRDKHVWK
jgi:hypothetical protein